jgi:hypothetical protein
MQKLKLHVAPVKPKGFLFQNDHTHNWENNCNSLFIVDLITLSLDTICLEKNHPLQSSLLQLVLEGFK